ncbi:protein-L-isoaspartate(D-aspartate) O-methyltransferase, partial [Chloroflexota bacterium]
KVLSAMATVPRELFVPPELSRSAYDNRPLSIGFGQTISQPLIVAMMTEALELKGSEKVLELGTGSGYQTAILAELAKWVISLERISQLAESAKKILDKLGYTNIEIRVSENLLGYPEKSPYNCIIVTAGSPCIPEKLLVQLTIGGIMVIPVGSRWEQDLLKITRGSKHNTIEKLGGCRFVPLIGDGVWAEEK